MATKMLESGAVSAFCESVAVMHSAGIQMDEAVFLLGENMEDAAFKRACDDVYKELIVGKPLALAMDDSGCFPSHVVDMAGAGEHAGRLENVLWSLARYYDEEDRLYAKIKNAIAYPAALLCVMSAILLSTVIVILPVFVDVYHGLTGNLTAGSFGYVNASIIIGWIALGVTLLCTVLVVLGVLAGRSAAGRQRLLRLFEKAPLTRGPMRQMAVSRFTAALATFVAAGVDTDTAMEKAVAMVDHGNLKSQLEAVRMQMTDPAQAKSLAQAIFDNNVFEPIYARMLVVGTRSGSLETVLASLSDTFFDDSIVRLDGLIDSVEPTLAAFLTVGVGATLIAVMLPLIGIMGSIG
ncbi:type II secretion system F family protein [Eggerthella lenta]|uniref:type II secretion system F family protein n=1 Tax=Eggerthella lenta TaxID=84112 RepID=UPI0012ED6C4C|nr:type II secretion system F family protein [Eggerthella lenta]MVN51093.1 type II secretion system F family protein [Eggerthella lenta]